MSVPDKAMSDYFRLVTRWSTTEIADLESGLAAGRLHPRDVKMKLAREIVDIFHGAEAAERAEKDFVRVFQQHDLPGDIPDYTLQPGETVLDVLVTGGLASTRSEGRRLVSQGGVRLEGELLSDPNQLFPRPGVLQAGKRRFLKVR